MFKQITPIACATTLLVAVGTMGQAEEFDIQAVIDSAMPHMHHSCGSILDTYADDEEAINTIVREMAFVSLYNREIDVLAVAPEAAESGALREEFVEELEDACDDDPGMLLAGAVDIAIKETMERYD
ncbi:MAG: hypothetical protein V2I76_14950 [Roseobacter sp.]|nr:hypothetical protein [Roseobacter sp.]